MLTSFTLENFKSFREPATLPLAPLTMLAGANASGKSNLVEALRLFSCLVENDFNFGLTEALLERNELIRGIRKTGLLKWENLFRFLVSLHIRSGTNTLSL